MINDHNLEITEQEYRDLEIPSYSLLASIAKQGIDILGGAKTQMFQLKFGSLVDDICFEPSVVANKYYRGSPVTINSGNPKKIIDLVLENCNQGSETELNYYDIEIVAAARKLGVYDKYDDAKILKTILVDKNENYFEDKIKSINKIHVKDEMYEMAVAAADTLKTNDFTNIYFQDEINFDTASALIKVMTDTAIELKFMQKQFGLKEVPSIKLYITSPGGIVLSAYMIIDAMKACEVPVDTIISGFAASAATIISIHGPRRFMQKNAVMLIHQASSTMWSQFTMEEIKDNYVNMTQMSDKIREMYASNTTMTKTQLKEILKHDLDWDSSECLRRGLVDEIL